MVKESCVSTKSSTKFISCLNIIVFIHKISDNLCLNVTYYISLRLFLTCSLKFFSYFWFCLSFHSTDIWDNLITSNLNSGVRFFCLDVTAWDLRVERESHAKSVRVDRYERALVRLAFIGCMLHSLW